MLPTLRVPVSQCFLAGSELLACKGAAGAFHGCLWQRRFLFSGFLAIPPTNMGLNLSKTMGLSQHPWFSNWMGVEIVMSKNNMAFITFSAQHEMTEGLIFLSHSDYWCFGYHQLSCNSEMRRGRVTLLNHSWGPHSPVFLTQKTMASHLECPGNSSEPWK